VLGELADLDPESEDEGAPEEGSEPAPLVREWRAGLLEAGVSESMTAKAYRLLRAILNTAVQEDNLIPRNPCRIRGADRENPAERPVLTAHQVFQLADAMRYQRLRALILVAASLPCDGERRRRFVAVMLRRMEAGCAWLSLIRRSRRSSTNGRRARQTGVSRSDECAG
jgi:hypothetical protein